MAVTWIEQYGVATAQAGIISLSVAYGSEGYTIIVAGQTLKARPMSQEIAKKHAITTARLWLTNALAQLDDGGNYHV